MRQIHCWWCGKPAEVDTELPESGGMVRDTETSWLCGADESEACARRALEAMERGEPRNKPLPAGA